MLFEALGRQMIRRRLIDRLSPPAGSDESAESEGRLMCESGREFACPHCGTAMPLPWRLIKDSPWQIMTCWCTGCHKVFDVVMSATEEEATQQPP
jgi:hypothetical protein